MTDDVRVFDRLSVQQQASLQSAIGAQFGSVSRILIIPYLAVVLVLALSHQSISTVLYIGLPGLMLVSAVIGIIVLLSRPGRLYVDQDSVAIINSWACYRDVDRRAWIKPIDYEDAGDVVKMTLGHGSYKLRRKDWASFDQMKLALSSAYERASSRPLLG